MGKKLELNVTVDERTRGKALFVLHQLGLTAEDAVRLFFISLAESIVFPVEMLCATPESVAMIEAAIARKIANVSFAELHEDYLDNHSLFIDLKLKIKARQMAYDREQFDRVYRLARYYNRDDRTLLTDSGAVEYLIEKNNQLAGLSMFEGMMTKEGGDLVETMLQKRVNGD